MTIIIVTIHCIDYNQKASLLSEIGLYVVYAVAAKLLFKLHSTRYSFCLCTNLSISLTGLANRDIKCIMQTSHSICVRL